MTKRTRTILFSICLVLFFLISPLVFFYSQGYRIDFQTKKISQTGALFLKVWPKSVQIYLNEKPVKRTDFVFGSALIENLLPKKYKVRIEKEGYFLWEKELEIKEKEVTEAKNIILIPKAPNFRNLSKGINNFYFSPDGKKVILKETEGGRWALKLYEPERDVKSHLIKEEDISRKKSDLISLEFSQNSKEISLEIGLKEEVKNFLLEIDKIPPILTEKEPLLPFEDVLTYEKIGETLYYLDKTGHLFKDKEKLTENPFSLKSETEYKLSVLKENIFLQEEKILYYFNPVLKSFEKFFESVNSLKISPDFKKIVYFSDYEIWIFFLEEMYDQPQKKAGERIFLTRFSEKIGDCFWYSSYYLIFNIGDKIKIAEIDERDRINIVDLTEFKEPKIFFNQFDKKLYILSEGNLYSSETLLP